jgi:phage gp16-like protein
MNVLRKNARMRAIFAACKAQGIDDDTRKAIQLQTTGIASLKDMGVFDLDSVLNRLNAKGQGKPNNEWAFVFKLPGERQAMAKKIFRLAERLGAGQVPPVGPMSKRYIEGIAEQMLGADTVLEFCDATILHKVVQALEIHCKRRGIPSGGTKV